ncbi:hypothetical protein HDU91_004896 [Kappamyces sp. JEL0680]|nr:hypothetical protein HDU91_004896 [Kappamyces sp. JEL0680]
MFEFYLVFALVAVLAVVSLLWVSRCVSLFGRLQTVGPVPQASPANRTLRMNGPLHPLNPKSPKMLERGANALSQSTLSGSTQHQSSTAEPTGSLNKTGNAVHSALSPGLGRERASSGASLKLGPQMGLGTKLGSSSSLSNLSHLAAARASIKKPALDHAAEQPSGSQQGSGSRLALSAETSDPFADFHRQSTPKRDASVDSTLADYAVTFEYVKPEKAVQVIQKRMRSQEAAMVLNGLPLDKARAIYVLLDAPFSETMTPYLNSGIAVGQLQQSPTKMD